MELELTALIYLAAFASLILFDLLNHFYRNVIVPNMLVFFHADGFFFKNLFNYFFEHMKT